MVEKGNLGRVSMKNGEMRGKVHTIGGSVWDVLFLLYPFYGIIIPNNKDKLKQSIIIWLDQDHSLESCSSLTFFFFLCVCVCACVHA
jgi:hypothetical protein